MSGVRRALVRRAGSTEIQDFFIRSLDGSETDYVSGVFKPEPRILDAHAIGNILARDIKIKFKIGKFKAAQVNVCCYHDAKENDFGLVASVLVNGEKHYIHGTQLRKAIARACKTEPHRVTRVSECRNDVRLSVA